MSGFPEIEADLGAQLIIVHMDDSESTFMFNEGEHWRPTRTGIDVHRDGGRTSFPLATVKSYTVVYPDESLGCPGCGH